MLSRDSKIATKLILDCKSKNQELLKPKERICLYDVHVADEKM